MSIELLCNGCQNNMELHLLLIVLCKNYMCVGKYYILTHDDIKISQANREQSPTLHHKQQNWVGKTGAN